MCNSLFISHWNQELHDTPFLNMELQLFSVFSWTKYVYQKVIFLNIHDGAKNYCLASYAARQCKNFVEKLQTKEDLTLHMKKHEEVEVKCNVCGVIVQTNNHLLEHMKSDSEPTNIERGLEESSKKLEETISIERLTNANNKQTIEALGKKVKEMNKNLEKADKRTIEVNENLKTISKELESSKAKTNDEIVKNEKNQHKIKELEELLRASESTC